MERLESLPGVLGTLYYLLESLTHLYYLSVIMTFSALLWPFLLESGRMSRGRGRR